MLLPLTEETCLSLNHIREQLWDIVPISTDRYLQSPAGAKTIVIGSVVWIRQFLEMCLGGIGHGGEGRVESRRTRTQASDATPGCQGCCICGRKTSRGSTGGSPSWCKGIVSSRMFDWLWGGISTKERERRWAIP